MEAKLGRPVLEVLAEYAERELLLSRERLETTVYIPAQGVVVNDRGKFELDENNRAFEMLDRSGSKAQLHGVIGFLTVE
eukprot:6443514-Prymnesium_polylepis.1